LKNYPNQASTIERIRRTLEVVFGVLAAGEDPDDDGVLGYAAARAQAYTFRDFDYEAPNLEARLGQRISQEQQKPSGSQGARTFARELRRTLIGLGWLDNMLALTAAGQSFLGSPSGSQEERDALALGLWDLTAEPGPSHPVRIMLRLLAVKESRDRQGLELSLEANDDSEGEFNRILGLYQMSEEDRTASLTASGVSTYQIANAKKVFPSLARDAGLVVEDPPRVYRLSDVGRELIDAPVVGDVLPSRQTALRRALRVVSPETIASALGAAGSRTQTPEEQLQARQALAERTNRHQETVKKLAELFVAGGTLKEGSVDLLWSLPDSNEPFVLVEVKTIENDADHQIRHAYGQLAFYDYFDVRPVANGRSVMKVVATDKHISVELGEYLDEYGVALITVDDTGWHSRNQSADALKPYLAQPPDGPSPN